MSGATLALAAGVPWPAGATIALLCPLCGRRASSLERLRTTEQQQQQQQQQSGEGAGSTCLACGIGVGTPGFSVAEEQRQHFKTDWHRYNVKRRLAKQPPVSEEQFEGMLDGQGSEVGAQPASARAAAPPRAAWNNALCLRWGPGLPQVSSISGSSSDDDDDDGGGADGAGGSHTGRRRGAQATLPPRAMFLSQGEAGGHSDHGYAQARGWPQATKVSPLGGVAAAQAGSRFACGSACWSGTTSRAATPSP